MTVSRQAPASKPCALLLLALLLTSGIQEAQVLSPTGSSGSIPRLGLPSPGRVWVVPAGGAGKVPFPTIQQAVDAASEGDTVLLSDGVFVGAGNRDVLVSGKNLVIRSENGSGRCIIDCQRKGRAFEFTGPEVTASTRLQGITIANGFAVVGGGVSVQAPSTPTIESCKILNCSARSGGGIYWQDSPPVVFPAVGSIHDCVFLGNAASASDGGGLHAEMVNIERCEFIGNVAGNRGGGLRLVNGTIRDSLIASNISTSNSGGIDLFAGLSGIVEGCTIVNNEAAITGGGIGVSPFPTATISNCIVWGNIGSTFFVPGGVPNQIYHAQAGFLNATITYCLVEGGLNGIVLVPGATPLPTAILDDNPLFVDPAKRDYRITALSPAIDAGEPSFVPLPHQADIDGEPRANGRRDMGMDEFYDGLAITYPMPGRAGEKNRAEARRADAGERVFFFYSTGTGATPIGFGACPELTLGLSNGAFLGLDVADGTGLARYEQYVQPTLSGVTIALQAVGFDFSNPGAGCSVSNVVTFTYP